jgi:chemotaxis protein MotB
LVSYADFITLLFAFFVVMYSISSVNEGKFRVLSDSLVASFKDPKRSMEPIQVGQLARSPRSETNNESAMPVALNLSPVAGAGTTEVNGEPSPEQQGGEALADIDTVASQVKQRLAPLIDKELVAVRREESWLELEIKTSILFASGRAQLESAAIPVLQELVDILRAFPNPVQVEGFTDNLPIRTAAFPSNWELSAARAASVVHLFTRAGLRPQRMVAIGYGEHRPIADNATAEGRRKNRRVVIVIPAEDDVRRVVDVNRMVSLPSETSISSVRANAVARSQAHSEPNVR